MRGKFVQHFWRRLCWIAFRIVGDSGSAEDVAQIAFERAWRNGVMFDPGRGSLDAWMTTIARNAALDWVRMKRAIPIDPWEICASPTPGSCDPEDRSGIEESRVEIRSALTRLSPILVRSVVLAGAFDMTAAEVARLRAHTARHGENQDPCGETTSTETVGLSPVKGEMHDHHQR